LRSVGTVLFANATFPRLAASPARSASMVIGPDRETPHEATSLFNTSAMSVRVVASGKLITPAVVA